MSSYVQPFNFPIYFLGCYANSVFQDWWCYITSLLKYNYNTCCQWNPVVPPTLPWVAFPHGTPPTTCPEKSHQFLPPLWKQHEFITLTTWHLYGCGFPIVNASPTIAKTMYLVGWTKVLSGTNPIVNATFNHIHLHLYPVLFLCMWNLLCPLWTLQIWIPELVRTG